MRRSGADRLSQSSGGAELAFIAHGIPIGPMSMSVKSAIRADFKHPAPASAANTASPSGALQITPWCRDKRFTFEDAVLRPMKGHFLEGTLPRRDTS